MRLSLIALPLLMSTAAYAADPNTAAGDTPSPEAKAAAPKPDPDVAAATVARNQGLTVNWTGGPSGSYVIISGSSASGTATGSYTCFAPQSAGQFTVPSYILLGLPAGTGNTTVQNSTNLGTFSANGLDVGRTLGAVSFQVNSNYN